MAGISTWEARIRAKVSFWFLGVFLHKISCNVLLQFLLGDSGGPLYRWYQSEGEIRAFLIGVVSRGTGCANFNQPGIFTKVSAILDFITASTQEGNCQEGYEK